MAGHPVVAVSPPDADVRHLEHRLVIALGLGVLSLSRHRQEETARRAALYVTLRERRRIGEPPVVEGIVSIHVQRLHRQHLGRQFDALLPLLLMPSSEIARILVDEVEAPPVVIGVDVQFEVTKVLNGMNDGVEPVEFEFELTGDGIEEAQTITIKGAGSEKFDPITLEQTGTYKYEIVEIDGGAAGYLYDIAKYIIEVTVTDEGGKLVADVQIKKDGQSASNVTFENNYEATPITDYAIEVNKVLEGRELREGEFSFTLYDEEGNEVMTVLNDADGKVIFDGLSFEKPDTYVFTVKENANENNSDVEFDENEYTITIVVKDNGEGELVIESDDSSDVTFTNIYHEPGRGDTPENPKTEDGIMRNIAMLAISVLGLIGTVVFGKRKLAEDEE